METDGCNLFDAHPITSRLSHIREVRTIEPANEDGCPISIRSDHLFWWVMLYYTLSWIGRSCEASVDLVLSS